MHLTKDTTLSQLRFVQETGASFFSAKELFLMGGWVSHPPRSLWKNIVLPLWIAEKARQEIGTVTFVNSAFRTPDYNASVGGGKKSEHLRFGALDLSNPAYQDDFTAFILKLRRDGKFKGGVGVYRDFVHIDCRGYNADW